MTAGHHRETQAAPNQAASAVPAPSASPGVPPLSAEEDARLDEAIAALKEFDALHGAFADQYLDDL
ncbi:hypothetical protein [Azospirillum griseum]|uniref:Uncharacterized protein n=1 Tax=Azospirillum griseum TaxID=2496639 RepID=A0A3S0IBC9_9PROT|nr:hypothetical protein [Azospirillum griseum]RTR13402.1 hypothetical protein EJ903_24695 [Azospirillum griseum]